MAGWTTGWMFVYTMQLVVQPVVHVHVQPVKQPVVSCRHSLKISCRIVFYRRPIATFMFISSTDVTTSLALGVKMHGVPTMSSEFAINKNSANYLIDFLIKKFRSS